MSAPRDDLFAGAAAYYARYRQDYPPQAYAAIEEAFRLDGRGTLLDLGTGTGQIALRLAPRFQRVVALDVSAEMVEHARQAAAERGVTNVEWHVLPAESLADLDAADGGPPYRLVTLGSAFHWMDQPRVLDLCYERTQDGGGIFIVALPGFISPDNVEVGDALASTIMQVVRRHLGERRRAGSGYFTPPPRRWEDFLADSRYEDIEVDHQEFAVDYDLDGVVGLLYSTSFANRRILGDRVEAFERELREALLALEPSGRYRRTFDAEWVLAHKRAAPHR
ncbi:MAG: class I SAM-dependent methyltransferase [Dehalococcoidia bacterium]